jgi:hypothetical protein
MKKTILNPTSLVGEQAKEMETLLIGIGGLAIKASDEEEETEEAEEDEEDFDEEDFDEEYEDSDEAGEEEAQ